MQIQQCPVLHPNAEEFANFESFVEKVDRTYKQRYGMVKVVPPIQWKSKCSDYSKKLENLIVTGPIEQNIFGKNGVYECLHIQKKSMSLKQYRTKMGVFDKITEGLSTSQIQSMFWKNIVFSPPIYGADLLNTLMDEKAGSWNLNNLNSLLRSAIDINVKGVTTSYCYIGSWKTMFCWHKEDLDLSAINFLHQGKSKFWYSIPANQSHIIQNQARNLFPEHFSRCKEYLRHKTTLINPYNLKKKYPQLNITKIQHKAGEFMLVLGGSYHCGFNFGLNIAEAINYGTLDWLNQLPANRVCGCSKSSVKANKEEIVKNLEQTKYKSAKQFIKFKKTVYDDITRQEEMEDEIEQKRQNKLVKSQFSKKIKKEKKMPKVMNLNGEVYKIDNWVQCDRCNQWRKLGKSSNSNQSFKCMDIGKKCQAREKIEQDYITL